MIAAREPEALTSAAQFVLRHVDAVFQQLDERNVPLKLQFDAVDSLGFHPPFDEACAKLRQVLTSMRAKQVQPD
ncbi:hypothetical protein [Massilia glaciei]|uniref:hypothetical protein n=1 Tax=Massilia glaciei TaxID=1524097 RepID=UPI001E418EF7|nr:hypothetical protein [Massilia glaciei]